MAAGHHSIIPTKVGISIHFAEAYVTVNFANLTSACAEIPAFAGIKEAAGTMVEA